MEERGLLNDAETMLCVAVVVKQCRVLPGAAGAAVPQLLVWFFQFLADPSDVEWNKDGKTKLTRAQLFAATVSLVALGLVSILALNAVRVINAVSFDYLLL